MSIHLLANDTACVGDTSTIPTREPCRFQVGLFECEVPAGNVTFTIEPGSAHPLGTKTYAEGVDFSLFFGIGN